MIQRTIKLHTGVEKTLNSTKIITKTEWQKSAEKLYGSDVKQWRFKCPICGHTASVQEIMSAGAKDPNCAWDTLRIPNQTTSGVVREIVWMNYTHQLSLYDFGIL